jgi:hypothetical protein
LAKIGPRGNSRSRITSTSKITITIRCRAEFHQRFNQTIHPPRQMRAPEC